MWTPVIRTEEYATVSELIDAFFALQGKVDLIETPVKMGVDGDFYPAAFADATHLLRVVLSERGYAKINHTHDIAWCIREWGDDGNIAETVSENGWLVLTTRRPSESRDWVAFVPNNVPDTKDFWAHAPNDQYTVWFSRAAELKPFLKELKEPVIPSLIQQE